MQLSISNNNTFAPLSLDLTNYIRVGDGEGMDTQDPAFREAVISHSLLKEGGVLALENLQAKELVFPLRLKQTTSSALASLVAQINQILTSPGMTFTWQDDGMSQATTFDGITGQFDQEYSYRQGQQHFLPGKLRLFSQPLGRTAAPRLYATASGVGPLLMISPYASGGNLATVASTQNSVAGFGVGSPGGVPSGGCFFWGAPSLAGDAPAQLQVSYVGPLPNTATNAGKVPYIAVSLLPDPLYRPLITAPEFVAVSNRIKNATAVASQYDRQTQIGGVINSINPLPITGSEPTVAWAGTHRLFVIARASPMPGMVRSITGPLVSTPVSATVSTTDWGAYDIGTFTLRASEPPGVLVQTCSVVSAATTSAVDVTAFVMLPDNATWFFTPTGIQPSQYGFSAAGAAALVTVSPYTNTLLLDDVINDQFIYSGQSQTFAPSPLGSIPSSARITQYSRGLMPRPDPKNGLPIIAILGVGQAFTPSDAFTNVGASWTSSQQLRTMAQVNVLERTRYVLP